MISMTVISPDTAFSDFGISTSHEIMPNGEKRFRLKSTDGTGYIRVENPGAGVWQNSHMHTTMSELTIVQKGYVILAQLKDGKCHMQTYTEREYFICEPGMIHNLFMGADTITHTVKFGDTTKNDWVACPELDKMIADSKTSLQNV